MKSWSAKNVGDVSLGKFTIRYVLVVPQLCVVTCASSVGYIGSLVWGLIILGLFVSDRSNVLVLCIRW